MPGPLVRIYGPTREHDSWSRVAFGMHRGLDILRRCTDMCSIQDVVHDMDDGMPSGWDAPIGVYVGPPPMAYVLTARGKHVRRAVMIAANSSWLPRRIMKKVAEFATELIAPSAWAADVLRAHSELPVSVWRHGVGSAFESRSEPLSGVDGIYRVLHMASTSKERKGTRELCRAWVMAREKRWVQSDAELRVLLSGAPLESEFHESISFAPRLNLSPARAAQLYCNHDLVCQPSRAEGFGLVPLEARACGVPVCATRCTGHAEHIEMGATGVWAVPHGPEEPVDDGPGAMAPSVDVTEIAHALRSCYENRDALKRGALAAAPALRQRWSWESVCRDWLDAHGEIG